MVLTTPMMKPPQKPYAPPKIRTQPISAPTLLTVTCAEGMVECNGTCQPAGDPC